MLIRRAALWPSISGVNVEGATAPAHRARGQSSPRLAPPHRLIGLELTDGDTRASLTHLKGQAAAQKKVLYDRSQSLSDELACEDCRVCSCRPNLGIAFKSAGQDSLSGCERESWLSLAIRSKDSLFDLIRYWN